MPRPRPIDDMTPTEMQAEIGGYTGRVCVAASPWYLRVRLTDLRARAAAGEDLQAASLGSSIISVSMSPVALSALERMARGEKLGRAELVRRALAMWAKRNGYEAEATQISGE